MNKPSKEKNQSLVSSVRIKEIDIKQHNSTTLLTPKKPNMIIANQTSQSDNKQLKLNNKKDLFRNKTFNNISYTPSHKQINPKHQSPFLNSNNTTGCGGSNNSYSNQHSTCVVGSNPSIKPIANSVKNTTAKQINYTSSITQKKQRPPLFVIQEKKIENQLTTTNPNVANSNCNSSSKEEKKLPHGTCNGCGPGVSKQNNISSSSKIIQMNKISFPSELSSKLLRENTNYKCKITSNRRNQNFLTVRTRTMPSSFKPKRESLSQNKTNKESSYLSDPKLKKIPQNSLHLNNTLNTSTKKPCTSNSIKGKEKKKPNAKKTNTKVNNSNSNTIQKNYFSLNGSCDNNSFSNSKSKIKSPSNKKIRQSVPIVHFYTNEYILLSYAKVLSQREVNELKDFTDTIYFIGILPFRKALKQYQHNDLIKSFIMPLTQMVYHSQLISDNNGEKSLLDIKVSNSNSSINLSPGLALDFDESYDDDESDYKLIIGDHINYRYEILQLLGKGSFGEAVKCLDQKTNEYVCIKLIKSHQRFQCQAMIEIKLLEHIKAYDINNESNIVKYYSNFVFRNHKCIVFELLDLNLYEYIKSRDYNGLELKKIKEYTTQLLFTLLFLKRNKIIHCDLKPENILLSGLNKSYIKTIDFGSSCFDNEKMYCYIQSRFYRAPEIILDQGYGIEIDMWSLGCIIAELFTGVPIFPGEDERDQLNYMMEYLDVPPCDFIEISRKREMFFDENMQPLRIANSKGKIRLPKTKTFTSFLHGSDDWFQDFIRKCLKWYPEERMKPEEGLMHHWVTSEMSSEMLSSHKQKIKRIKNGYSKCEEKNTHIEHNRSTLKQKSISSINNNRSSSKKRRQGSRRFKVKFNNSSSTYTSNNNYNHNNSNALKNNVKPLSTKNSTTGKFYVSLSLEDNANINNSNYKTNPQQLNNNQQPIHQQDKEIDKTIEIKLNDMNNTSKVIQQKYSFIDLDDMK